MPETKVAARITVFEEIVIAPVYSVLCSVGLLPSVVYLITPSAFCVFISSEKGSL